MAAGQRTWSPQSSGAGCANAGLNAVPECWCTCFHVVLGRRTMDACVGGLHVCMRAQLLLQFGSLSSSACARNDFLR